ERTFEADQPAPLIRIPTPHWPPSANEADINVSFIYDANTGPQGRRLARDATTPGSELDESLAGIDFQVEPLKGDDGSISLVVTERHQSAADKPAAFRALVLANPAPRRVVRRYLWTAPEIHHIFTFETQAAADACEIQVISRNAWEAVAYRPREPLRGNPP
ncbi:MAG: hypothetical protein KF861_19450, partial [Planctomycetaceae bacterium]|nr:hypothetical protein [Planctomycetaceae bacterium]